MPSFGTSAGPRPPFIPFEHNLGPWVMKFTAYREGPNKKFQHEDGTPKTNAFLDFEIIDEKVKRRYPDVKVIKTLIGSASIWKSADGTRSSALYEALKVLAGKEPNEDNIWFDLTNAKREPNQHPTDKDLLNWITGLYGVECRGILRPIQGEGDNQKQSIDKLLPPDTGEEGDL